MLVLDGTGFLKKAVKSAEFIRYYISTASGSNVQYREKIRRPKRAKVVFLKIAKRSTVHRSSLAIYCRIFLGGVWLFHLRRLRGRYEKGDDVKYTLVTIGCIMFYWNSLANFCFST